MPPVPGGTQLGIDSMSVPERRHFSRNPKWGPSDFGLREKWRRSGIKGNDGENLGKPSHPEALSRCGQIGSPPSLSLPERIRGRELVALEPADTRSVSVGPALGNQVRAELASFFLGEPNIKIAGIDVSSKTVTMAISHGEHTGNPVNSRIPPRATRP